MSIFKNKNMLMGGFKMDGYLKIKCGKLYDGLKNSLQEDMEILIKGKKINIGK